jgi:hypothetical protein
LNEKLILKGTFQKFRTTLKKGNWSEKESKSKSERKKHNEKE